VLQGYSRAEVAQEAARQRMLAFTGQQDAAAATAAGTAAGIGTPAGALVHCAIKFVEN
jgi:hypothetical protein